MPNKKNIEPYSNMVRDAAKNGGPEKFLNQIAEANREIGRQEGLGEGEEKGFAEGALVVVGVMLFVKGVKWSYNKLKDRHSKRMNEKKAKIEELQRISDDAKKAYLSEIEQNESTDSEDETAEADPSENLL